MSKITGKVWNFGANIDTDIIIAARYLNSSDPEHLAKYIMEDADPEFPKSYKKVTLLSLERILGVEVQENMLLLL